MAQPPPKRTDRFYQAADRRDQRDPFQRDRDRVLYTSAFRRLVGVTQVVHAGEGQVFHNRLTHTFEVGQIAQRLAQFLLATQPALAAGEVDPEVAQAAAWAHDLGHPPFGHVGEETLDRLVRATGVPDGFEGNAQSFRIVTRLAVRSTIPGLNLTRATLNAILKYPWLRSVAGAGRTSKRWRKFGAYQSEYEFFKFARALNAPRDLDKSIEAEIMDWADDIAYAVHDFEDFYRAGLIPVDRLLDKSAHELDRFFERVFVGWKDAPSVAKRRAMMEDFSGLLRQIRQPALLMPYDGGLEQRAALRNVTSSLIGRYVSGQVVAEELPDDDKPRIPIDEARLPFRLGDPLKGEPKVIILARARNELALLKRLIWVYIIKNPRLASQQVGQCKVIETLFSELRASALSDAALLSPSTRQQLVGYLETARGPARRREVASRVAADAICRMTEAEALKLFLRLAGVAPGSVMENVVL